MATLRIPQQLKDLRKKFQLTQDDVSRHLNVTRAAYSNYESGKRTPTIDCLAALAKLYSTSVDTLLGIDTYAETAATAETIKLSLSYDEKQLILLYRELSDVHKKELLEFGLFKKSLHTYANAIY